MLTVIKRSVTRPRAVALRKGGGPRLLRSSKEPDGGSFLKARAEGLPPAFAALVRAETCGPDVVENCLPEVHRLVPQKGPRKRRRQAKTATAKGRRLAGPLLRKDRDLVAKGNFQRCPAGRSNARLRRLVETGTPRFTPVQKLATSANGSVPRLLNFEAVSHSWLRLQQHQRSWTRKENGGARLTSNAPALARAEAHPFTHTTCFSVCTTSTRSRCASITASMSL